MPYRIYRGTKVYLIRSPCPCLLRGPPSDHVSPLVTLIELFLNSKPSFGRGEPRQTGKAKQIDKKIDQGHSGGAAATGIPKCLPHDLSHRWQWWESPPLHRVSPHLEMPR
jgi:hypothetical protein